MKGEEDPRVTVGNDGILYEYSDGTVMFLSWLSFYPSAIGNY